MDSSNIEQIKEKDITENIINEEIIIYKEPFGNSFTIYTKSGCKFCTEVKKLLKLSNIFFQIIDCDDYILENKQHFLEFIQRKTNSSIKTFPIVFNEHQVFIGGYMETEKYLETKLTFEDDKF
jgi:glutaredoxin